MEFYLTPVEDINEAVENILGFTVIHPDLKVEEFNFPADDTKRIPAFGEGPYLTAYDEDGDRMYLLLYKLPDYKIQAIGDEAIEISLTELLGG